MSKINPFDQYVIEAKEYEIKSLGATVTLRKLTLSQSEEFMDKSVKGLDKDDNPIIDMAGIRESNYAKVSLALVDPKMTIKQLKGLGSDAKDVMVEILDIIDPMPKAEAGKA